MLTPQIPSFFDLTNSNEYLYMSPQGYPFNKILRDNSKLMGPLFREISLGEEYNREQANGKYIVYISLGTVFNKSVELF